MNIKSLAKKVLTEKENRKYAGHLAEIKVDYADWLREQEQLWRGQDNGDAGETLQDACNFVLICAAPGVMSSFALKNIARYFNENPSVLVVYGDEDVQSADGKSGSPWFKPDWSPDFLDSCSYFGSLVAVRQEKWEAIRTFYENCRPGQYRELFRESAEHNIYFVTEYEAYEKWLHHLVRDAYEKNSRIVGHLPQILFHAADEEAQVRFLTESAWLRRQRRDMMADFFTRYVSENVGNPLLSVVIPSKDQPDILRQCIENVRTAAADIPCEIVLVDNGSKPENKAVIETVLREYSRSKINGREIPVNYVYEPMEFNFSRMCNLGAEHTEGKLLLFLNDDVELCEPGCAAEMAARAVRSYTGAVGMKLLYPDSGRIQHAGITNLPMGPVHKLQFQTDDRDYYGRANRSCRNFLAVTAACLMVEKTKFREAGGFSEDLRIAFNDVDFCFRLHELGYYNVCLNDIYAYHHESLSRGADESAEKLARLLGERDRLYRKHPELAGTDPYYSACLNREGLDTRICPAYVTSGNHFQRTKTKLKTVDIGDCRQDDCLMLRVEDCRGADIVGYGVVLGDNNACYEKTLLLRNSQNTEAEIFGIPLEDKYRPDLEENLPDQVNVALGGFMVEISEGVVPEGGYRIGILARNRVTGGKLVNWSNRIAEL